MSGINGKVVLITGASSGIGEATALLLARSGAKVVLGARRDERLEKLAARIRAEGGAVAFQRLDVTNRADVARFVAFARETFGRVDVIVNNAGIMPLSPLSDLKVDEWDRMIDVNIRGVLNGIAAGLPVMKEQGAGQFINVSSVGGYQVYPTTAVYSATKFAVRAISEGLRLESDNIRVTTIAPGVVESELAETISDPAMKAQVDQMRSVALKPDAIARSVLFAIEQPAEVNVTELIVRPSGKSPF